MSKYVTIKRGTQKVEIGSPQHRYLLANGLPHSVVTVKNGKKSIKRVNT